MPSVSVEVAPSHPFELNDSHFVQVNETVKNFDDYLQDTKKMNDFEHAEQQGLRADYYQPHRQWDSMRPGDQSWTAARGAGIYPDRYQPRRPSAQTRREPSDHSQYRPPHHEEQDDMEGFDHGDDRDQRHSYQRFKEVQQEQRFQEPSRGASASASAPRSRTAGPAAQQSKARSTQSIPSASKGFETSHDRNSGREYPSDPRSWEAGGRYRGQDYNELTDTYSADEDDNNAYLK